MKFLLVLFVVLLCPLVGRGETGHLTSEQALELALSYSPELRAARLKAQSARKNVAAAGMRKNPDLNLESEGLGWDNDLFG